MFAIAINKYDKKKNFQFLSFRMYPVWKQNNDKITRNVSRPSKDTLRDTVRNSTLVARINAVMNPIRSENNRLAKKNIVIMQPIPANADGRRADSSVIAPNGIEKRIISQNNTGGLSGYFSPLRCGSTKSLLSHISLETCAYLGSSGAQRSRLPRLNKNNKDAKMMINAT